MTDEELDKIIFDTIPAPLEAGIDEMRSLVMAGMRVEREACVQVAEDAERRKWDTIRTGGKLEGFGAADIAAAIRKRGEG
jgi:IS5 family transposase